MQYARKSVAKSIQNLPFASGGATPRARRPPQAPPRLAFASVRHSRAEYQPFTTRMSSKGYTSSAGSVPKWYSVGFKCRAEEDGCGYRLSITRASPTHHPRITHASHQHHPRITSASPTTPRSAYDPRIRGRRCDNSFALYRCTGRWYQRVSGDLVAWNIRGTMVICHSIRGCGLSIAWYHVHMFNQSINEDSLCLLST